MGRSEYVRVQGSFCGAVDTRVGEFDLRGINRITLAPTRLSSPITATSVAGY